MQFSGTQDYISTEDLTIAVNASITLEKPLLVKGEPGTGKTELARQIAQSLDLKIIEWNIKSTTKAQQGLYEYDAVSRLRDSQLGNKLQDINNYIKKGKIWDSFGVESSYNDPSPIKLPAFIGSFIERIYVRSKCVAIASQEVSL